jgi:dimethylargininase
MTVSQGVALVRAPSPQLADGIVTHIAREPVDVDLARQQHAEYCAALTRAGWHVENVEPAPAFPDSVFVEDTVVVVGELALLTRPGAPARRAEVDGTEATVDTLGLDVRRIDAPAELDGGDVLQVGSTVYVGRGGRTNGTGVRELRRLLATRERIVVPVELYQVLHLKSAVTALPDGTLIGVSSLVDRSPFPTWREVTEVSGCHVVPLGGDTVLMAESAPRTAAWLTDLGFDVVTVDISEFEKLEGCVTCLSVLIPGLIPDASGPPPR